MSESFCECVFASTVGEILLISWGETLSGLYFPCYSGTLPQRRRVDRDEMPFREALNQLSAYFAGELQKFDLPLHLAGTPFQQRVWRELLDIPYGMTISYAQLAQRIGSPSSSRAVGAANGKNPISIIVPCHRVVGADGSLTGYGGGLNRKQWLLQHEAALIGMAATV